MPKYYEIHVKYINVYGKDLIWEDFQEMLHDLILIHRPEECLELEIITLLRHRTNKLLRNMDAILHYLNKYCLRRRDDILIGLLDEGGNLHNTLVDIINSSVEERFKNEYSDKLFIRRLFSIKGCLFNLFDLMDDINRWNKVVFYALDK